MNNEISRPCNMYKKNNKIYFEIELPGINKKDILVNYENGYLIVNAKSLLNSNLCFHNERQFGVFNRKFYVGKIEKNKIRAKYILGLLYIIIENNSKVNLIIN